VLYRGRRENPRPATRPFPARNRTARCWWVTGLEGAELTSAADPVGGNVMLRLGQGQAVAAYGVPSAAFSTLSSRVCSYGSPTVSSCLLC
jgi:hypothetical protein